MRRGTIISLGVLVVGFALMSPAQPPAPAGSPVPPLDATALVRRAVQHRLDADKSHRPMRYLLHVKDERHETTKEIIETKDGDVARLVAVGGQPLSAEADQAELARLDNLAAHPELQEHRKKGEEKDQARVDRLMAMLPDALLYKMEGMEACPGASGTAGQCYKLSYAPNPKWTPPDMEAKFLRGIAGEVWIDQRQERLTKLNAHFIENVDFGFGLLGKVNKGGVVLLDQTDVGGGEWELTSMKVSLTGDAFFHLKTLNFQIVEEASQFEPVPAMGYRAAIEMLKKNGPAASDAK